MKPGNGSLGRGSRHCFPRLFRNRRHRSPALGLLTAALLPVSLAVAHSLLPSQPAPRNERYALELQPDRTVMVHVAGMTAQRFAPEFTVLWSATDPRAKRDASHPGYAVAPRVAVRWRNPADASRAADLVNPFAAGQRAVMRADRATVDGNRLRWEFSPREPCALAAELSLPAGEADPVLTFMLTPQRDAFFSVAYTGAPAVPLEETRYVPQECAARGHRQFDFVMSEADLHLPRAHVATGEGNVALAADPGECRFRLPTFADSRFGFLLASDGGRLQPVLLAPVLGGAESRMRVGEPWRFTFRCVVRAGDWKATYAHIARNIHGFRDLRDNSGPGSLNATLERVMDFLAGRRGGNRALWDEQQKYYDYFTDKTGVFKPFSALCGLSAAIVTDDEAFFRARARPAVEFALSRRTLIFAPYDSADNRQANSAGRTVGAPVAGYAQLLGLHQLLQRRSPVVAALAAEKGPAKACIADALARWQLSGDPAAFSEAQAIASRLYKPGVALSEQDYFDLLDLAEVTREPAAIAAAVEAAYQNAAKLNLYPAPPDTEVTVDRGGRAPVHPHSFGRHKNQWGFPRPQPVCVPEQTAPAWRISRLGLPGIAYPIEYWMNTHGATMRTAALAGDPLLRDLARAGMVGRFGNFPGDNRSLDSLIPEAPDAVEAPPWQWNFATVNPGHAWDFAAQVLDFLVSDACERSRGAIDFPSVSAGGSSFRVRLYGARAGRFYGDQGVHLWLPRGLVTSDNRQLDWLAAHGHGHCYLAVWNQSAQPQRATLSFDPGLVRCAAQPSRVWRDNQPAEPVPVRGQRLETGVAAKGIVAFAIPAEVRPRFQAKLLASAPPLDATGHSRAAAPFGTVHAMLLCAGPGLTSAFVYTEALPEHVIAARLCWRQGDGVWQRMDDGIYPYEFSPELCDGDGAFQCVLEIQNHRREVQRSPLITLGAPSPNALPEALPFPEPSPGEALAISGDVSGEFVRYLQEAANGPGFGLRADGRFYPYSTPQGRRIAWRQRLWDLEHFATGCTPDEAGRQLRRELAHALAALRRCLGSRTPAVDFARLTQRQQETLLDHAWTEGVTNLQADFLDAVLNEDWSRLVSGHLYIRYAGHVPDHPRNRAFARRWGIE